MFDLDPAFWWAIAGIALIISELILPGVILVFFGFGALLTALASWLIPPLTLSGEIIIFAVASLGSLLGLRRFLKPFFTGHVKKGNLDDSVEDGLVGETGSVTKTIEAGKKGKISLHGASWSAEAEEDIEEGAIVEVIGQKSLLLKVKRK